MTRSAAFTRSLSVGAAAVFSVLCLLSAGCKEDPPPPPLPGAPGTKGSGKVSSATIAARKPARLIRMSNEMMKRNRVEACLYGSYGLFVARDAYLKSLGGQEPSTTKIPEFGNYPENEKRIAAMKKAGREVINPAAMRQLPFVRHVRACSIAKSLNQPEWKEIDDAVKTFEAYATRVNKTLLDASRYYQGKRHEKDEMKRGKQFHKTLTEEFPKLDAAYKALADAVHPWRAKLEAPKDATNADAKKATAAIATGRAATNLILAETYDAAKAKEAAAALGVAAAEINEAAKVKSTSPFARSVGPKLEELKTAVDAAVAKARPSQADIYNVTAAMATVVEADQRAYGQFLRQKNGGGMKVPSRRMGRDINLQGRDGVAQPAEHR